MTSSPSNSIKEQNGDTESPSQDSMEQKVNPSTPQSISKEETEVRAPPASYMRLSRISCDPCRKRKLRCSRTMPCSTCVRRGIADQCYQETDVADSEQLVKQSPSSEKLSTKIPSSASLNNIRTGPSKSRNSIHEPIAKKHKKNSFILHHQNGEADAMSSEQSLYKAQQQLRSIASIVKDSESSISHALQGILQSSSSQNSLRHDGTGIRGTGPDGLIRWKDVAPFLPTIEDCEEMMRLFFDDLGYYFRVTQRSMIDKYWHKLLEGAGLERQKMMILCVIFALADGTAPSKSKTRKASERMRHEWINLMGNPLTTPFGQSVNNSFECVSALILLAIYYMFMGQHDRIWECMGVAVRKGFNIGLFDERHRSWQGLTNIEKEYRRRLAWYMLSLERWQAFMRQLPSALHPDNVHVALASFEHDSHVIRGEIPTPHITPTFPMTLADGRLQTHVRANDGHVVKFVFIELLAVCHDFLDRFSSITPSQRYSRAQQIDDLLERTLVEGLSDTGIDLSDLRYLRYLSSQTLDTCPEERQLGVNMWVSHLFFLRCTITRRFLTDENAPSHLRFISLTYAQGIVSAIPTLTRKVKEGLKPVQMTWNANHLLCAATAFAVVILGHDPYAGIDSDPLRTLTGKAKKSSFPQEQVQWLADNIFSTLECLDMLVEQGNGVAVVAKRLLESLVGSQEELRNLYRKRISIGMANEDYVRNRKIDPMSIHDGLHNGHSWHSPRSSSSYWSPSTSYVDTPNSGGGGVGNGGNSSTPQHHQQSFQQSSNGLSGYSNQGQRAALPPMQPYPPPPPPIRQPPQHQQSSQFSNQMNGTNLSSSQPIIGRFMNASSLLDAVLMEPLDLDFEGKSNTSDLLASLLQQTPAA